MSLHLNLSTGKFLNSSTLFKLSDALLLDVSSGEIVMSNLLVPRAGVGVDLFKLASLDLNFAQRKSLNDQVSGNNLITFTRASSGTYVDSDGLIKTAVTDAPRFDHDPVTGESLGLLIEEERTNYATQSANPSAWSPTNGATGETFAAVTAPDGSTITQGFRLPDGGSRVYPTLSSPGTVEPVASVYARAVSGTATLSLFIQGVGVQTGVTVPSDSWVRLNGTKASANTTSFSVRGNFSQSEDVYFWGAQLEEGSFPSSYIPTSGSTVTRAADVASIEGTNFTSWFNQSEGTVFSDVAAKGISGVDAAFAIGSSNDSDRWLQQYFQGSSVFYEYEQGSPPANSYTVGSFIKSAIGRSQGDNAVALNGSIVQSDTYSGTYNPVFLKIGVSGDATRTLNGHIARLAYFPTRKTDQELIKITDGTLDPAIITYGITSTGGVFNLRSFGTVDYAVDWDSTGGYESSTLNTLPHTYTAGNYDLVVYSDGVYRPLFANVTADASQITSVVIGAGANLGTVLESAWYGANNMTSFVCPFDVTSGVTSFIRAWRACSSLSSFPLINTSSGTNFSIAWRACNSLTSMPLIATSSGTNFRNSWRECSSLTTFPANMFDTTGTLVADAFQNAWQSCALTAQSIENILVSLDTNGASNITLGINGGTNAAKTTWSTAANTAYDNLITKGWTIAFNA